jgi:hypothetical protein
MKLTEEQLKIKKQINDLILAAKYANIYIAGFAFSTDPPIFINFGNCADAGELRLYRILCDFRDKQLVRGAVETEKVTEVN